jgi:hypothetical protein
MLRLNSLLTVLVVGLSIGLSLPVHAQTSSPKNIPIAKVQKPFRIKLGVQFAADDFVGSTLFNYGVSYDFLKTNMANPVTVGVYLDGATNSRKKDGVDRRLSYVGIGPSARYFFTPVTASSRIYGGLGVGAYFTNAEVAGESENKTLFGGKVLAGIESGQGIFGELDYTFISKIIGVEPGGFNLSIGYRF